MAQVAPSRAMLSLSQNRLYATKSALYHLPRHAIPRLRTMARRRPRPHSQPGTLKCGATNGTQSDTGSQSTRPVLPAEVLERRLMQQELELMSLRRVNQDLQAREGQRMAKDKKARRVMTKLIRRAREATSQSRLLQTKLNRLTQETDLPQLHATIEEQEEAIQRSSDEARVYKNKFLGMEEKIEEIAYQGRRDHRDKVEAQLGRREVEAQRQRDLEWYQEAVNSNTVFGQFLFEHYVKEVPSSSGSTAASTSEKRTKKNSKQAASREPMQHYDADGFL